MNSKEWQEALAWADRAGLTLVLRDAMRDTMPDPVRARVDRDAANNAERLRRIRSLHDSIAEWLSATDVEFLVLKGAVGQPNLGGILPESRVQYDIDLYCPPNSVERARDALLAQGYESLPGMEEFPTDHLPALIKKTGWQWRGDYFDPEIPVPIELHFRFWDEATERLAAPGVEEFWERRIGRALHGVDALGYAALHLLRHLLRGNVRAFHIYELACMLRARAHDPAFWENWRAWHPPALRRLEAVSFQLAQSWFEGAMAPEAQEEIEALPEPAKAWFEKFGTCPLANKEEIWLHLSLLESRREKLTVLRRRLLPARLPGPVDAVYVPESEMTWRRRAMKQIRYARFVASRAVHHAAALPRVLILVGGFGREFWTFLAAASLYNFGLFIFVLLYNLRLIDLGFHEDFLGAVSGAGTAGCLAGAIPAALLARRFGLRRTLLGCLGATGLIAALRALATAPVPLLALSFAGGLAFAIWAVAIAPTIAYAVPEKRRPAAFSVFFAIMIGIGTAGGWIGGRLPIWLHGKTAALLAGAGIAALSLWPASRLRPGPPPAPDARVYPRGAFLWKFLAPFALWRLATGSFNPFFNSYFARLHFSVERIGTVFSGAQAMQAVAVLAAPLLFRRAGLTGGIVWMMAATSLGLAGLAAEPPGAGAVLAYSMYMVFQWISEPGMNTLLMNGVQERERGGASALMYLAAFSADAVAAFAAGALVAKAGYGPVLGGAAALAGVAAALFHASLRERSARRSPVLPAVDSAPG